MTEQSKPPLRGDAAWKAFRAQVDKNNDAARRRGKAARDANDAKVAAERADAERREFANLPVQPDP